MDHLIAECYDFIKDCGLSYAFCGGYALELFANTKYRAHSDVDITLFEEERIDMIEFLLSREWDIYEHLHSEDCLRKITKPNDEKALNNFYLWAIKPGCSFFQIMPKSGEDHCYHFKILDKEQKKLDFIDIIFNTQKDGRFNCDKEKGITRDLKKAVLYHDNIPCLAPEVILFFISDPAYIESDYHREKTNADFEFIPPLLPKESMEWLISAIEKAYPEGNKRLEQLKFLQCTL